MNVVKYLSGLLHSIPRSVIIFIVISFVAGVLILIIHKGARKEVNNELPKFFLAYYVIVLICSTVVFRKTRAAMRYDLVPFRSYKEILNGNVEYLLPQVIMNVLVFIPIGYLLKASFTKKKWWQVLFVGIGLSVIIETSQLLLHKGFCEIDDVIHNGIGCQIGILLASSYSNLRISSNEE